MKREMLIHKEEELSMEIDKYKKIGKWNTIISAGVILFNFLIGVVFLILLYWFNPEKRFWNISQEMEEVLDGMFSIGLLVGVYSFPVIVCMAIFSLLAFLFFVLGRRIAPKKPEKLFGFANAQLIAMALNLAAHIAQVCIAFFLCLLAGGICCEDFADKAYQIWQNVWLLTLLCQICYGLGVFVLLGTPLMNLKKMIKNERERRRLKEIADLNETPWRMKD